MTRQRFEGLRRELIRRFMADSVKKYGKVQHTLDGKEYTVSIGKALKMDHVDWSRTDKKSYAELWEAMKPVRDMVGM